MGIYTILRQLTVLPSTVTVVLTQGRQGQGGDIADVTRGQHRWQQQGGAAQHPLPSWVQMIFSTHQHDKGTSQELSHSMQWRCYLGWGDVCVGGWHSFIMPHKNKFGRDKKIPTSIWKEGGIRQDKRYEFFLQDRLLNRLFLFTEAQ